MSTVANSLDAIAKLTAAIGTAQTLPSIFNAALDGLREAFGVARASILLFDADGVMRFKAWRGLSPEYRAAVEGHTPWTPGQAAPRPVVVTDICADPSLAAHLPAFRREGIAALAFFPLISERGVIGKFMLYRADAGGFPPDQVNAANAIGYVIGFAVERTQRVQDVQRERQRLLFALDAAHMGTWDWDITRNQVQWSENLERIHGLPPGTFTGAFESYEREIHPDDRQRVLDSLQRALRDDVIHDVEYRIVAPDGTVRWVQGRGRVERDGGGTPIRMSGVCMDISERRRVEEENARLYTHTQELLAEEESLRARLTTLTDGSVRLLTSLSAASVVEEVLTLAAQVVTADAYAVWRRHGDYWVVAGSRGLSAEFISVQVIYKAVFDQPVLYANLSTAPIMSERAEAHAAEGIASLMSIPLAVRGETSGSVVFYFRTPHQPPEAELRVAVALGHMAAAAISNAELYEEARQANRLKDEFLATLSHELRTPLNVIAGRARMLGQVPDLVRAREVAAVIDRNSTTLGKLVDDLLDVSRMTIGQVTLDRQRVDLAAVIAAAIQAAQSSAEAKDIAITASVDPAAVITGDAIRLQQIAWNLLTNAVKFTPPGGTIEVSAQPSGDTIEFTVRDSGQGIDAESIPHVFDMFWQADPLPARRHSGLGLGLSIVRKLAELQGGTVRAESAGVGRGSTFTVTLPRRGAAAP